MVLTAYIYNNPLTGNKDRNDERKISQTTSQGIKHTLLLGLMNTVKSKEGSSLIDILEGNKQLV